MDSGESSTTPEPTTSPHPETRHREGISGLDCLFRISDAVERAEGSLENILQETAELLPRSWSQSDVASARIVLGDFSFESSSHQESPWSMESPIVVHGKEAGTIEVAYREPRPEKDEGPFTMEERRLLNYVAERMGRIVERLTGEERLREKEEEFRERMMHVTRISTMGEMASSIAHEVNQPLTAVATYAQACRRMVEAGQLEAPEVLEILERIGEESLRAGDIIHRLRDMVRRGESDLVECDINHLLQEILPLASVDARLNEVELRFRLPEDRATVVADGVQIQQVVLNLIRNGIDAMSDTPKERRILEVRVNHPGPGQVQVSVSDQGCGLPDVSDRTLFEPFFTTKEAGLGLGLSISRSIVSAHGGQLSFRRRPRGGTTFFFTLPTASETRND